MSQSCNLFLFQHKDLFLHRQTTSNFYSAHQGRRKVWKSGGACSTGWGWCAPPGRDRVNWSAKNWGSVRPPATPFQHACIVGKVLVKLKLAVPSTLTAMTFMFWSMPLMITPMLFLALLGTIFWWSNAWDLFQSNNLKKPTEHGNNLWF